MLAYGKCPCCGLKMGSRKEPTGRPYRCRKCRAVVVHVQRHPRTGESLMRWMPGDKGDPNLMTIPRV